MPHLMSRLTSACVGALITLAASAQTPQAVGDFHYGSDRQALVYEDGHLLTQEGGWSNSNPLRAYAATHPGLGGDFILFQDPGSPMRQLTDHASLAELQAIYAPMTALKVQQHALAERQQPLAAQQSALAAEMRAATTPAQMAEIGGRQGKVGQQQGEIGRQQGALGEQQGAIGRAFYAHLQRILDACLRANTCPVVAPSQTSS